MKVLCAFGKYQYGDPSRGLGTEYEAFIPAIKALGYEVRHFETWDKSLYPTYADLNRALLAVVAEFRPDILFTVQRDYEIWLETLQTIRNEGIALATWTTDDSFKFPMVSRFIAPYYDAISTTYDYRVADYQAAGIKGVYLTQWAANTHWLKPPQPASECKYAVSFVGTKFGPREEMVKQLQSAGVQITCFGYGWPNGPVQMNDIPEIMRDSVISLNFSAGFMSSNGNDFQIKARTFEVPGAGGFLLTEDVPGLASVYKLGKEIDVFRSLDQLTEKCHYYLANPEIRDCIAQAGFERTAREHTYEARLKGLLDLALERRSQLQAPHSISPVSMNAAYRAHELTLLPRLFRRVLVRFCQIIWGKERGLKAARRLTFEISYRLVGARTFTAKGIPGKLFPNV